MALTMTHLLVADEWAKAHPEYRLSPEFFYGAISPDAIHIRDGNDKSHKDDIHLKNWREPHPDKVIAYWLSRSEPFDIGYGVHVLTDAQWVPYYRRVLPQILKADGLLNTDIYYNDCFVTEFSLYSALPRLEGILKLIEAACTPHDHPLLTGYELEQWRNLTLETYRGQCPYHEPVRFIDEAYIDTFVRYSIPMIEDIYQKFISSRP